MKKYTIKFTYQDRSRCGFHLKDAKRTVKARSLEEAIQKIERSLMAEIISLTVISETEV